MTTEPQASEQLAATESPSEGLLDAWLKLNLDVRGNRALQKLTFNQMAICHFVEQQELAGSDKGISQSVLCRETKLLKSQMNKELCELEKLGILKRSADPSDKRCILVSFADKTAYEAEHEHVLRIFGAVVEQLGTENTLALSAGIKQATQIAGDILKDV